METITLELTIDEVNYLLKAISDRNIKIIGKAYNAKNAGDIDGFNFLKSRRDIGNEIRNRMLIAPRKKI